MKTGQLRAQCVGARQKAGKVVRTGFIGDYRRDNPRGVVRG